MAYFETVPEQVEAFNLIVPPEVQHLIHIKDDKGNFLPMKNGDRIVILSSGDIELEDGHTFKHKYRLAGEYVKADAKAAPEPAPMPGWLNRDVAKA